MKKSKKEPIVKPSKWTPQDIGWGIFIACLGISLLFQFKGCS